MSAKGLGHLLPPRKKKGKVIKEMVDSGGVTTDGTVTPAINEKIPSLLPAATVTKTTGFRESKSMKKRK